MANKELAARGYKSTKTRLSKIYVSDLEHGIINTNLALIPNDKKCFYSDAEEQRIGRNVKALEKAEKAGMNLDKTKFFARKKDLKLNMQFEGNIINVKYTFVEIDPKTHKEVNPEIRYLFKNEQVIKICIERLN